MMGYGGAGRAAAIRCSQRTLRQWRRRSLSFGDLSASHAGGPFSKISSPSADVIQGCLRLAQMCRVVRSQDVSSSVPARTRISPSLAGPAIQEPHSGQTHRVLVRPLSARRWSERGSTPLSRKPFSGITTPAGQTLAISAMAGVDLLRRFGDLVSDRSALAAAGLSKSSGSGNLQKT